jgi:hypothetical protein
VWLSHPTDPHNNNLTVTVKHDVELYDSKDVCLGDVYTSDVYDPAEILTSWIGKKVILWGRTSNYCFTSQLQWNRGETVKGWKVDVKKIKQGD